MSQSSWIHLIFEHHASHIMDTRICLCNWYYYPLHQETVIFLLNIQIDHLSLYPIQTISISSFFFFGFPLPRTVNESNVYSNQRSYFTFQTPSKWRARESDLSTIKAQALTAMVFVFGTLISFKNRYILLHRSDNTLSGLYANSFFKRHNPTYSRVEHGQGCPKLGFPRSLLDPHMLSYCSLWQKGLDKGRGS